MLYSNLCVSIVTCLKNKCAKGAFTYRMPSILLRVYTTTRYVQDSSAPVFCPKDRKFLVSNVPFVLVLFLAGHP
jgi:hypothetical protein